MKVLLVGEYSNVHATLAEGLRSLGHEVTVVSNGDFWKNYPRDIDVARKPGKWGGICLMAKLYGLLPKLRGYDIVQLINPMFFELKAERLFWFYNYLRRHNKKVFLGGFGMDWYWVYTCTYKKLLRYSDFNIGEELRTDNEAIKYQQEWLGTTKERLNRHIAEDCDGIITGLYEYDVCYRFHFPKKTTYIPFPIRQQNGVTVNSDTSDRIRAFIGINRERSAYKGTDIMLQAALDISHNYPERFELIKAESVPFAQYQKMMDEADILLDQLYSYTPSMNSLLAMSKGIICIGGGESESYDILGETELRPVINVQPNYESVYQEIEKLILHPERIPDLKRQSLEYVCRHHDFKRVAQQYIDTWSKK
ncbi:Glycosyltransferase involved in cell wall bisynthesis [Xylanibacter ruminicola]|uniref:Glycosyltransferase involved in cell wall bisynthesis n=1 Tax=Xylanibacter ruminicola TaxID=839 RepID=A0A1H5UBL3_XYLRU|nr:glycosyltransferase [Xylanibacter ruminicola]SEF71808.1 Glycosyltransferase involved in cell wall bisynthesis [Xylanibacter ruminicola]